MLPHQLPLTQPQEMSVSRAESIAGFGRELFQIGGAS